MKQFILIFMIIFSTNSYANGIIPVEIILKKSNNYRKSFTFVSSSPSSVLYEVVIFPRIPDNNGVLSANPSDKNFNLWDKTIPIDSFDIQPKRFIVKPKSKQKISISFKDSKKIKNGSYVVGFMAKFIATINSGENKKIGNKKNIGAKAQLISQIITNINVIKGDIPDNNTSIKKAFFKNKKLNLILENKNSNYFGYGKLYVFLKNKKIWDELHSEYAKVYEKTRKLSIVLPKKINDYKGEVKIEYRRLSRFGNSNEIISSKIIKKGPK